MTNIKSKIGIEKLVDRLSIEVYCTCITIITLNIVLIINQGHYITLQLWITSNNRVSKLHNNNGNNIYNYRMLNIYSMNLIMWSIFSIYYLILNKILLNIILPPIPNLTLQTSPVTARRSGRSQLTSLCLPVYDFEHPEKELFVWSLLFNRRDLSQLFWRLGKDHISGALLACAVLKSLARQVY